MSVADPHKLILTGENPFLRMSDKDGDPNSTDASFWRILFCPAGPGHVLYIKSEVTHGHWRIYSDNIAMARWLQQTVQGMLNPDLKDLAIPVTDAEFSKAHDTELALTWYDIGEPLLIHTEPNQPPNPRPYGVCTVLVPALSGRLTCNGQQARGKPWKREREGRPFSTSALAFSESWTEPR